MNWIKVLGWNRETERKKQKKFGATAGNWMWLDINTVHIVVAVIND